MEPKKKPLIKTIRPIKHLIKRDDLYGVTVMFEQGYVPDEGLLFDCIFKHQEQIAIRLVEYGADVNERRNGRTPFYYAVKHGLIELVEIMLPEVTCLNMVYPKNKTVWSVTEDPEVRRLLLDFGFDMFDPVSDSMMVADKK